VPIQCVCVFLVNTTTNSDYFAKQYQLACLRSGTLKRLLRGANRTSRYFVGEIQASRDDFFSCDSEVEETKKRERETKARKKGN